MIAYSLSHWGIITMPDSDKRQNVQFNQDQTIEPFEPGQSLLVTGSAPTTRRITVAADMPQWLMLVPHETTKHQCSTVFPSSLRISE